MPDEKTSEIPNDGAPTLDDRLVTLNNPGGTPETRTSLISLVLALYDSISSTFANKNFNVNTNSLVQSTPSSGNYLKDNGTKFVSADFATDVAATAAVTANTAKVTNATHTGDVTGSTTLTLDTSLNVKGLQDLFIPAGAMWSRTTNGAGGLTKVETGTNKINYQTWEFDATTQEYVQFSWIPPRNYNNGTVKFTFWWSNASGLTTETVDWNVAGVAISNDDVLDVAMGTAITTTDTWLAQNDVHISPQSTAVTIAGTPADSDFIMFEISRKVSTDNLTGDARLIGVVLEYTIDAATAA